MFEELKEILSFGPESDLDVRSQILWRDNELSASDLLVDQVIAGFEQQLDTVQSRVELIARQTNALISNTVESVESTIAVPKPEQPKTPTAPLQEVTPYEYLPSDRALNIEAARARVEGINAESMSASNDQFALF